MTIRCASLGPTPSALVIIVLSADIARMTSSGLSADKIDNAASPDALNICSNVYVSLTA